VSIPHLIIILDNKLDCVAAQFPEAANAVESLRALCHAAEALVAAELDASTVSPLHAQLHAAQLMATELCGSSGLTEGEVTGQVSEMAHSLEKLM